MTKALIVDDHPIVHQACRRLFEDYDACEVAVALRLVEAFQLYRRLKPEIVVVDLTIGGRALAGLSFIRRLRMLDQKVQIQIPVPPDQVDLERGTFDDLSVQKGFVMLNIYVGFQMAATRAQQGDYDGAWNVLDALELGFDTWLAANPDFDIEDDLGYIRKFKANIDAAFAARIAADLETGLTAYTYLHETPHA